MKKLLVVLLAVGTIILNGCSYSIIPPAHKGKLLTTSGFNPEVLEPSRVFVGWKDKLVLLETSTKTDEEHFEVVMNDKLTLKGTVQFQGRISGTQRVINGMFNDISTQNGLISYEMVYKTYGKMHVLSKVRSVLSTYSIEDVTKNRVRIEQEVAIAISQAFEGKPLTISDVTLGTLSYPKVITEAIEKAEQRRQQIAQEQAQMAIDLLKIENALIIAQGNRAIVLLEAQTVSDQNKILSEGVTPELLRLKQLDINLIMAKNAGNANATVYLPVEGLTTPGASVRMFNQNQK